MIQISSLLSLLAGAALLGLIEQRAIPPAAWLSLTLVVHAARSMPAWPGLAYVWIVLYASMAISMREITPIPGPAYLFVMVMMTTTVALPFAIDRLTATRLGVIGSTLVFPIAFTAVEFLRSRFAPPATWGSIAYSQFGVQPVMQVAAVAGIWGITFLVAWAAATAELAWSRGFVWNGIRTPVLACLTGLAVVVTGGLVRLALAPTDRASIRATTLNRPVDLFVPGEMTRITEGRVSPEERPGADAKLAQLQAWFLDGSRREARAGAKLIVWPEGNLLVFSTDERAFLEHASIVARDERVYLAMGLGTIHLGDAKPFENKLVIIGPDGRTLVSYRKTHPVQGWEEGIMKVGDGHVPVATTPEGRIAGAICFDADFPEFIRQAALGSADLFVLPVNEWKAIKDLHFQMHAFRAIETGVPIVRAAASGLSTAFDPWGRVLGVTDFYAPGDRTLTVQVPIGRVRTLYSATGDLFAWLCVASLVGAIVLAITRPAVS